MKTIKKPKASPSKPKGFGRTMKQRRNRKRIRNLVAKQMRETRRFFQRRIEDRRGKTNWKRQVRSFLGTLTRG